MKVGASGGPRARSGRQAKIELRTGRVTVLLPKTPASRGGYEDPIEVLAGVATETGTLPGKEPLHWVLLSPEETADAPTAHTVVGCTSAGGPSRSPSGH